MDWSELPDLVAIGLLICAFASTARSNPAPVSLFWLIGWVMVAIHFATSVFIPFPGFCGIIASMLCVASLTSSGVLFQTAVVPFHREASSRWMMTFLLAANAFYVILIESQKAPLWTLDFAAVFLGLGPLTIALFALRRVNEKLRWTTAVLYLGLSIFLLLFQNRPGNGSDLAENAVLFTVFLGCTVNFFYVYSRATAGAFITIAGFLAWALVFLVGPLTTAFFPAVHVEREVWNLPKFIVAVGMILLLLEDQVKHTKHLALHDELTGLPNRRLFLDRLASALDRARRTGSHVALLVIDLDRFKDVNDTLGHHVGDLLLQRVGAVFAGRVRRSDTVARTGGDEFSIVVEEPTSRPDALFVGNSLMELLKEPLRLDGREVQASASIGIAVFPEDASDLETLCIAADLRMYDDKHGARDCERNPPSAMPFSRLSHLRETSS